MDGKTRVCGLIANPVEHSMSPMMHNFFAQRTGVNLAYVPFKVEEDRVGDAVKGAYALNIPVSYTHLDPKYVFQEQKKGIKPMEANNENPIIQLVGLGKQFQTMNGPVTALEDINLEIRYGEVFGIIGLSGAGKSTLVRCINYLEVPTSGKVVFEGKNLSVMKDREKRLARQSMGMIFQQFNLLSQRNVLQNVCFPLEIAGVSKAEAKKRAEELLTLVGLEDRMKACLLYTSRCV